MLLKSCVEIVNIHLDRREEMGFNGHLFAK